MKIITMTDSKYFEYGRHFMETRHKTKAEVICYGPDLTGKQAYQLDLRDIKYVPWGRNSYENEMQLLKFVFLAKHSGDECYFLDWDTYITRELKSWPFDVGLTLRPNMVAKGQKRAYCNGGVIYSNVKGKRFWDMAHHRVAVRNPEDLQEYDEIWKALESNTRPEHKRHYRHNFRWWVDQVYLSALLLRAERKGCVGGYCWDMCLVDTFKNGYVKLDASPAELNSREFTIGHVKSKSGAPTEYKG